MELNSTKVIALYREQRNVLAIAKHFHVGTKKINTILEENHIEVVNKKYRTNLPEKDIIDKFDNGTSVKQLAIQFGVDRSVINRLLAKHGLQKRNGSESMYLRMAQTPPEERKRLVTKAHDTVRNKPKEYFYNLLHKGTITKHYTGARIGIYEEYVFQQLYGAGLNPIAQQPVGLYNVDIVCGCIALEIHITAPLPHTHKHYKPRVVSLLKQNYCVVYYKTENRNVDLSVFAKLVYFCKQYRYNTIMQGIYFCLDADCEVKYMGRLNNDDIEITFTKL